MLSSRCEGSAGGPLLVLLHWLGGGAQTWLEVSHGLAARGAVCAAIDLPGFGLSASVDGYGIEAMADQVIETIRDLRSKPGMVQPWLLAGHSMGGTVGAVVARRAVDGEPDLQGLRGLVLVSASPPGPEPVSDAKRTDMLDSLGVITEDSIYRQQAGRFVDDNTGTLPLPPAVRDRAVAGVMAMNRDAFRAWLEDGSKEDWREVVGQLALPALIFAGTEDGALGPDAQRTLTLPHFPQATFVVLEAAGHLAPLERPGELIEWLTEFIAGLDLTLATPHSRPSPAFEDLEHSERTSPKTAEAMSNRLRRAQNWNARPQIFSGAEFRTLRALAQAIVPEAGFDLAACVDAELTENKGDGWRFAALPPDREAWHRGLVSLDHAARQAHGVSFLALYPDQQQTLLQHAAEGKVGKSLLGTLGLSDAAQTYTAEELQMWLGEVRTSFTRLYMGDPRTLDRIGYTGFADDLGFTRIQLGQTEVFER